MENQQFHLQIYSIFQIVKDKLSEETIFFMKYI